MTREQAAKVRTVVAALPAELTTLPAKPLPSRVPANPMGDLIRDQLKHRTVEQLVARIERRWVSRGYLAKLCGLDPIETAKTGVGLAVELIKPSPDCPDLSCEDGLVIGSSLPCKACTERRVDRRFGKKPIPPQASENQPMGKWWCTTDGCGYNSYGTAPTDGLCHDCRSELELDPADVDPQELAEAAAAFEELFRSQAGR